MKKSNFVSTNHKKQLSLECKRLIAFNPSLNKKYSRFDFSKVKD